MKIEQDIEEMTCKIFRSDKKHDLYLYLQDGKSMDDIPEDLLQRIGSNTQVMELDLSKRDKLAQVDIKVVRKNLINQGYHIQFPNDLIKNVISYT